MNFWLNPCNNLDSCHSKSLYLFNNYYEGHMKKTLLSIIAVAGISSLSFGQVEIYVDGGTTNYAGGGVLQVTANDGFELVHEIHFENHSGGDLDWKASRKRIDAPATWEDFLCWGHETNTSGGLCIDAANMDVPLYTMPNGTQVTVADGEYGFVSSHITPDASGTVPVTYRYYIGTPLSPFQDSMDIVVNFNVEVEEIAPSLTVNVAPNPANDYININASGVDGATVRIVDVLGNVVLKETAVAENKKVNVAKFRNGIYFVMVEAEGVKPVTRKVIVRH